MERVIPLLKYMESVSPNGLLTLAGTINPEKTELSYLKDRTKIMRVRFQALFNGVSDIETIDKHWMEKNSIVWETITWSSGRKEGEFITMSNPSEVHIYFTLLKVELKVKSNSQEFLFKVEEFCHRLGIFMSTI
jgi:hypothetical protein